MVYKQTCHVWENLENDQKKATCTIINNWNCKIKYLENTLFSMKPADLEWMSGNQMPRSFFGPSNNGNGRNFSHFSFSLHCIAMNIFLSADSNLVRHNLTPIFGLTRSGWPNFGGWVGSGWTLKIRLGHVEWASNGSQLEFNLKFYLINPNEPDIWSGQFGP